MKTILFAAALSVSGLALAQTATTTTTTTDTGTDASTQPSGQTVDDPSQSTGPQGVTQQGTDPQGQAVAPAGANQVAPGGPAVPAPNQQAVFTPQAATQDYPPCSRTVTDNCIQTYERGVRRSRR